MNVVLERDRVRPCLVAMGHLTLLLGVLVGGLAGVSGVNAQQVVVSTPMQVTNDHYSSGWGFRLFAEQASRRSFVSQTPTLVVPNGGTGALFSGSIRPFVVGVVPVVGDGYSPVVVWPSGLPWATSPVPYEPGPSVLQQRLADHWQAIAAGSSGTLDSARAVRPPESGGDAAVAAGASSAQRGDLSVREIRRQRADLSHRGGEETRQFVERGRIAEAKGKRAAAKVFYQMAARRASASQRVEIIERLKQLNRSSASEAEQD